MPQTSGEHETAAEVVDGGDSDLVGEEAAGSDADEAEALPDVEGPRLDRHCVSVPSKPMPRISAFYGIVIYMYSATTVRRTSTPGPPNTEP